VTTSTPPAQTVCDAETTVTLFYQGPEETDYEMRYVTYYTWATVWVRYVSFVFFNILVFFLSLLLPDVFPGLGCPQTVRGA
jgi:hypothetical protein